MANVLPGTKKTVVVAVPGQTVKDAALARLPSSPNLNHLGGTIARRVLSETHVVKANLVSWIPTNKISIHASRLPVTTRPNLARDLPEIEMEMETWIET